MTVDFNLSYPLFRLHKLHAIYREKAAFVDGPTYAAPKLTQIPNYLKREYAQSSREVSRLGHALKFCQALLNYRRSVQERLASLSEKFSDFAIELSHSLITESAAEQKLKLLSAAVKASKDRLGFYGGLPISLCITGYTINDWSTDSASPVPSNIPMPPKNLKDGLETFMHDVGNANVALELRVKQASQFLLEKVLARHEQDCQIIESAICTIQSDIKTNRNFVESFSIPMERRILECSQAKTALERFFSFRIADRQTWKRFEEALFRNT